MLVDAATRAGAEPQVAAAQSAQGPSDDTLITANQQTTVASGGEPAPEPGAHTTTDVREEMRVDLNEDEDIRQEDAGQDMITVEAAIDSTPLMQPKAKKKSKTKEGSVIQDAEAKRTYEEDSGGRRTGATHGRRHTSTTRERATG